MPFTVRTPLPVYSNARGCAGRGFDKGSGDRAASMAVLRDDSAARLFPQQLISLLLVLTLAAETEQHRRCSRKRQPYYETRHHVLAQQPSKRRRHPHTQTVETVHQPAEESIPGALPQPHYEIEGA